MIIRSLVLGLCMIAVPVVAQPPSVETTPIKGSLHLLQGRGGNVVVSVGADGVAMIDSDYGNYAPAYEAALKALGGDRPRYLINTHWHGDHTGGNAYWGERGSVIMAQDNVLERMSTRQENKFFGRVTEPSPVVAWPVITYADSSALRINGDTLELQHYPKGHTDGDSVVFFMQQNVAHFGDQFFKDRFPFIDMASGGTVAGYVDNLEKLLTRVDAQTIIVPGHGALANRSDLQRFHEMLVATRAEVKAMQDKGMDLAAIQAAGLDPKWESWGNFFIKQDNWIGFLVASP
jgi:cyclase